MQNNKYKINNSKYSISFVEPNDNNLRENNGLCNTQTKEIFIDVSLKNLRETIIHEITHAIIYEYLLEQEWNEEKVALFVGKYFDTIKRILGEIENEENL